MNVEIPKNAVVVSDAEPLEERLREHPLRKGQYYYFLSGRSFDGLDLPTDYDLYKIFNNINDGFLTECGIDPTSPKLDNGQNELLSEINTFLINGQTNTNS